MPELRVDGTYAVTNLNTLQSGKFTCNILLEYRGFYVLQGTIGQHDIHVVRGIFGVNARPVAFAFSESADRDRIMQLNRLTDGKPLALVLEADIVVVGGRAGVQTEGKQFYPILNAATDIRALGSYRTNEDQVMFACKLVDLFHEWQDAGFLLPNWFRASKALTR